MATNIVNSRPICTYPIPMSIQSKLSKAGFLTTGSVATLRPSELSSSDYKIIVDSEIHQL